MVSLMTNRKLEKNLAWLALGWLISLLVMVACAPTQSSTNLPGKGNPKLDSQLNQLLIAQAEGNAAAFAEQHNIRLENGAVRVIIEAQQGQLEAAAEAATNAGAKPETSYGDSLQAVVPLGRLTTLAEEASIRFISLPVAALPLTPN